MSFKLFVISILNYVSEAISKMKPYDTTEAPVAEKPWNICETYK